MILVTGATGFVGDALVRRIAADPLYGGVVAAVRQFSLPLLDIARQVEVGDLSSMTDWSNALQGVDTVVHCAARAHVMNDLSADPLQVYRDVNVYSTLNLARQASRAGVRRFIFLSSVKVLGELTLPSRPFIASDVPAPQDSYAISKLEAECGLRELEAKEGIEIVIVRPPLVYGPGAKANFASMMRWLARGIPLPFGAIHNSRSMVALDNLIDFLSICLKNPAATGQTFLVSDGEDVSTTELLRRTAKAMGRSAYLLPVPVSVFKLGAAVLFKQSLAQRLCGSLQVDIEKSRCLLGWSPSLTLDAGLEKAVKGWQL